MTSSQVVLTDTAGRERVLTEHVLLCPHPSCGALLRLRWSSYGPFYGCIRWPECKESHGAYTDGRPLGVPTTIEGKKARQKAHASFDRLWKTEGMTRSGAYLWMSEVLGLCSDEAHIGRFDIALCQYLEAYVEKFLALPEDLRHSTCAAYNERALVRE